jgi:4-hydroxy-tetrahydrodipicolinate reductase
MSTRLRYAIIGSEGAMGGLVINVLKEREEHISVAMDRNNWNPDKLIGTTDVAICFTNPDVGYETTKQILSRGINAVVGTTAFYKLVDGSDNKPMIEEFEQIAKNRGASYVISANFSISINLLLNSLSRDAKALATAELDPIVLEAHHIRKKDAPSGTALEIGNVLLKAYQGFGKTGLSVFKEPLISYQPYNPLDLMSPVLAVDSEVGRYIANTINLVPKNKIPVFGLRVGNVVGTHVVHFISPNGVHNKTYWDIVNDRKAFAYGAVDIAGKLRGREPGRHMVSEFF